MMVPPVIQWLILIIPYQTGVRTFKQYFSLSAAVSIFAIYTHAN